jgi:hypothetical protein
VPIAGGGSVNGGKHPHFSGDSMNLRALLAGSIIGLALAAPAGADVTFKQKVSGKGIAGVAGGDSTQYIKGVRMRTDQTVGGNDTSTIIDAGAQQMVVLDHKRREATVYDMTKIAADIAKMPISDVKASVTPTTQTRQIAGTTCTIHDMHVAAPTQMGPETLTIVLAGPICLVKNGPGQTDFTAFYKAAAEKGLFLGDPRAAKAQAGQARSMTAMYQQMAALGVPMSQEINFKFEGSGAMAGMMAKIGANSMTTEVVSVSTDPIADSTFDIPAGYRVVKR